jgi:dTDP-4-amino-4,6-dideoxy-D-glucose acyltransferase
MSFFSDAELFNIGFASLGENVKISRKASIYGAAQISIGSNVRVDDFCILSAGAGGVRIGSYIHIAAYSSLIGRGCIDLGDYCNISARVSIYSNSDDYSGRWMTNPMVPTEFTEVNSAPVYIGKHAIVGAGSVILPGSLLELGVAVGALSLIKGRCGEFGVYCGVPARRVSERNRNVILLEEQLIALLG